MATIENWDEINAAAREIYAMLLGRFQTDKGAHVGTLVSAAARLAGSSLLRSFEFFRNQNVAPGNVLLSDEANEEWPKLMNMTLSILKKNKVDVDPNKMIMKAPAAHAPRSGILEMQAEYQEAYFQIANKHHLDYYQAAFAGAIASAIVILQTHSAVDPQITCGIAAMGFVEGSKTMPAPLPKNDH